MSQNNQDFTLKILTLGNSAVGKTCFILRYCKQKYIPSYQMTIGVNFFEENAKIEGQKVRLHIWDTAGQEKFRSIVNNFYNNADGIFVAYSVEDKTSFDQISYWMQCIQANCDQQFVQMVLIANKSDSNDRVISKEQGANLAKSYNIPFFETSARLDKNCEEAVKTLSRLCYKKARETGRLNRRNNHTSFQLQSGNQNFQEKKKCC